MNGAARSAPADNECETSEAGRFQLHVLPELIQSGGFQCNVLSGLQKLTVSVHRPLLSAAWVLPNGRRSYSYLMIRSGY